MPDPADTITAISEGFTKTPTGVPEITPGVDYYQAISNLGTAFKDIFEGLKLEEERKNLLLQDIPENEGPDLNQESTQPVNSGLPVYAEELLNSVSTAEGTGNRYDIIVGGKSFTDYSKHPNIVGMTTSAGPSTAAGRFQITKETWDDLQKEYPDLTDFSPINQKKAAWYLAKKRYKLYTDGRDLEADLINGDYSRITKLGDTWTGIKISPNFEKTLKERIKSATPDVYKIVGFTNIKYDNANAIRNLPVAEELENKIDMATTHVFGPGYTAVIFSGGQISNKPGEGTGSIRHNIKEGLGQAADVRIYDRDGIQVTNESKLIALRDYWIKNGFGSAAHGMKGGGIHLDIWTKEKLKKNMGLTWTY
jgi:muramidase (phage lysozyme)